MNRPKQPAADASTIPHDDRGRRAWLKYQLALRGYSLHSLGNEIGVTRQTVRLALVSPYPKMQRVIAEHLGVKPEQIWPERYEKADAGGDGRRSFHSTSTHAVSTVPQRARRANGQNTGRG